MKRLFALRITLGIIISPPAYAEEAVHVEDLPAETAHETAPVPEEPEAPPAPETPAPPPSPSPAPARTYSVQVGAYRTPEEASVKAASVPDSRIEVFPSPEGDTYYRVLVGQFPTVKAARAYTQEHKLNDQAPDVWVHSQAGETWSPPVETPAAAVVIKRPAEEPIPAPAPAPQRLQEVPIYMNFNCDGETHKGNYKTRVIIDPNDSQSDIELKVKWACAPGEKVEEHGHPSGFHFAPSFGFRSAKNNNESATRTAVALELGLYRSFGLWGVFFDYELEVLSQVKNSRFVMPPHELHHRFILGAHFPLSHAFTVKPKLGLVEEDFLMETTTPEFKAYFFPAGGLDLTLLLLNFEKGTSVDLTAGYWYIFGLTNSTRQVYAGHEVAVELGANGDVSESLGSRWFFRYVHHLQSGSDLDSKEDRFSFGLKFSLH